MCGAVLSRSVVSDSYDCIDCSPPGSSVRGILQARILEWVSSSFSKCFNYSVIQRNKIIPSAATWTDLEIIMLREVSQAEKDKYHMISLICGI